jgi:transposase-like protein
MAQDITHTAHRLYQALLRSGVAPRLSCQATDCPRSSFVLDPAYKGRMPEIKEQVVDMSLNGSGIRDTARVLKMSPTTVINELKKSIFTRLGEQTPAQYLVP